MRPPTPTPAVTRPLPLAHVQVGIQGNPANPTNAGLLASGGPTSIVVAVSDKKLRVLEDAGAGAAEAGAEDGCPAYILPPWPSCCARLALHPAILH